MCLVISFAVCLPRFRGRKVGTWIGSTASASSPNEGMEQVWKRIVLQRSSQHKEYECMIDSSQLTMPARHRQISLKRAMYLLGRYFVRSGTWSRTYVPSSDLSRRVCAIPRDSRDIG